MNLKKIAIRIAQIIFLTIILFISYTIASIFSGASGLRSNDPSIAAPADPTASLLGLITACALQVLVFAHVILRARWHGWKLAAGTWFAFYGLGTVMLQIESAVFLPRYLPPGSLITLFSMGAITGAIFLPIAILILGKHRPDPNASAPNVRLVMPAREWIWKFAAIAIVYVIVYYTFGYFVAWKDPAVQAYYGGTDPGDFFAQLGSIWATTPWMFFFQAARGMLWAVFTMPVIRMYRGANLAIITACLLAVWVAMLLIPNPLMPDAVRRAHIWETAPSNFIFGFIIGWLLTYRSPQNESGENK